MCSSRMISQKWLDWFSSNLLQLCVVLWGLMHVKQILASCQNVSIMDVFVWFWHLFIIVNKSTDCCVHVKYILALCQNVVIMDIVHLILTSCYHNPEIPWQSVFILGTMKRYNGGLVHVKLIMVIMDIHFSSNFDIV